MPVQNFQPEDTRMDLNIQVYLVKDKRERKQVKVGGPTDCDVVLTYVRGKMGMRKGWVRRALGYDAALRVLNKSFHEKRLAFR
jgi:hypothetical protein